MTCKSIISDMRVYCKYIISHIARMLEIADIACFGRKIAISLKRRGLIGLSGTDVAYQALSPPSLCVKSAKSI